MCRPPPGTAPGTAAPTPRTPSSPRTSPAASQHPLLGGHVSDPQHPGRHLWQTPVSARRLPWLGDHQVSRHPVPARHRHRRNPPRPCGAEAYGTEHLALHDLSVDAPLVLDPEPQVTTHLVRTGDTARAEVLTTTDDGVLVHARATVRPLPARREPRAAGPGPSHHTRVDRHRTGRPVPALPRTPQRLPRTGLHRRRPHPAPPRPPPRRLIGADRGQRPHLRSQDAAPPGADR